MKNKKKVIIASGLFALALAATSIGTTFALFTDRADTKIDVKAGIVDVSASIKEFTTYSAEANETDGDRIDENGRKYISKVTEVAGVFTNSGTADVSSTTTSSVVDLKRITPGDRVTFNVELGNASNVNIKYRVFYRVVVEDLDLAKAMSTTLTLGNNKETYVGLYKYESPWTLLKPTDTLPNVAFDIELPINKGNEYQNESAQYMLGIEAVQGNASVSDGKTVSTIYEDARETSVATDADVVVDATNRDNTVRVVTTIPAAAKEVTSGQTVELVVSDLIVENTDQEDVGKLVFDASLFVNGKKTTSFSENVKVQVYLGKDLEITELTHNNEIITDFTYDRMEGLIEFYTQKFSPFGVGFKKLVTKKLNIVNEHAEMGSVKVLAKTGVKDADGKDIRKEAPENNVYVGETVILQALTNHGYDFLGWRINGEVIEENNYECLVSKDVTNVEALFDYHVYDNLSFTSENETMGTVTATAGPSYQFNQEVTLNAIPTSEGYSFVGWYKGENLVSTDAEYKFRVYDETDSYVAKFVANKYSLNFDNANTDLGSISLVNEGIASGDEVDFNTALTLKATPNTGVHFDGWYLDGSSQPVSTDAIFNFTMPANDYHLTARFSWNNHNLTLTSSNTNGGSVTGGGSYHYGEIVTVKATAQTGYSFVGWFDGDTKLSANDSYEVTMPDADYSLVAKFETTQPDPDLYTYETCGTGLAVTGIQEGKYTPGMDLLLPSVYNGEISEYNEYKGKKVIAIGYNTKVYGYKYDFQFGYSPDNSNSLTFGTVTLNSNITRILKSGFSGYNNTNSFKIKEMKGLEYITEIEDQAFNAIEFTNNNSQVLNFPNLKSVGNYAFRYLDGVAEINIDGLESNGYAFRWIRGSSDLKVTFGSKCTFKAINNGENGKPNPDSIGDGAGLFDVSAKTIHIKSNAGSLSTISFCRRSGSTFYPATLTDIYFYNGITYTLRNVEANYKFFVGNENVTIHLGNNVANLWNADNAYYKEVITENLPK